MEFQEFPKCLYKDGTDLAKHRIVNNEAEQKAADEEGYQPLKPPTKKAKADQA